MVTSSLASDYDGLIDIKQPPRGADTKSAMNFLILGNSVNELAWARAVDRSEKHRLLAIFPGFAEFPDITTAGDLDEALALAGIEAAVVGGDPDLRAEVLRRVAASGLPAICLHPPGPDSEAYYQVAMSRLETGAVIVPDLSDRLHPGVSAIRDAIVRGTLGSFRELRYESTVDLSESDLVRHAFARSIDIIRSLIGEIAAVSATGDPPGDRPVSSLVVQVRGSAERRAEVRFTAGPRGPSRLIFTGENGTLTLESFGTPIMPSRLTRRSLDGSENAVELEEWDPFHTLLTVLDAAVSGQRVHPDLADGTRAMEVSEGVARSLRRGRTVELHYEQISEAGTFKSVMTSIGCMILLAILIVVPLALAGPPLGLGWTIYFAYLIPPVLVGYVLLQLLRFALRGPGNEKNDAEAG